MATNLTVYANVADSEDDRATTPANYIQVDLANDKLIWSAGSTEVADGADTPTSQELDEAATIIQPTNVEIANLFLLDVSDTGQELKDIDRAGSVVDGQHVINFSFDGPTASEPQLEAWDDDTHATANLNVLGLGTPSASMVKAILTTSSAPGTSWTGTAIAGGSSPNVLLLNGGGGAFGSAAEVYINIKIDVPGAYSTPFSETPVLTVRYTYV